MHERRSDQSLFKSARKRRLHSHSVSVCSKPLSIAARVPYQDTEQSDSNDADDVPTGSDNDQPSSAAQPPDLCQDVCRLSVKSVSTRSATHDWHLSLADINVSVLHVWH